MLLGQSPRAARWRWGGSRTARALLAAALVSAVVSAGEVAAANLLTPANATPTALALLDAASGAAEDGAAGPVYAVGAALAGVTVVAFLCSEWLRRSAARAEAR